VGHRGRCPCLARLPARQPPPAGGAGPRPGDWRPVALAGFSRPGCLTLAAASQESSRRQKLRSPRTWMPPLFDWGPSSKAPKPPLERLRAGCKPAPSPPTTLAYIRPENVRTAFLSRRLKAESTKLLAFGFTLSAFFGHRGCGDLLLSNQERKKAGLSRERGINGRCGKGLWVYAAKVPLLPCLRRLPSL
jgi:hypothetical protein